MQTKNTYMKNNHFDAEEATEAATEETFKRLQF